MKKPILILGIVLLLLASFVYAKKVDVEDSNFKMEFYPEHITCYPYGSEYRCYYNIVLIDKNDNTACFDLKQFDLKNNKIKNKLKKDTLCSNEKESYFVVDEGSSGKFDVEFKYKGKTYIIDPYWTTNSTNFNGTYYQTYLSGERIIITPPFEYGWYKSQIFDAGYNSTWNSISWALDTAGAITEDYPNLQLLYHFDEPSGNIEDYSVNNNTGYVINAPKYEQDGIINYSMSFDGSDDYINTPHNETISFLDNFTIMAWVNLKATDTGEILEKESSYKLGILKVGGSAYAECEVRKGAIPHSIQGSAVLVSNIWTHLTCTYDGTELKLYENGILASNLTLTGDIDDTLTNLTIAGDDNFYKGRIDELALWNTSLTLDQIQEIYRRRALNLSVRGCIEASCSSFDWIDYPDISPSIINLTNYRFFQYQFEFYKSVLLNITPELYNVSVEYDVIPKNTPIASENILNQYVNIYETDCLSIQWNVTDPDNDTSILVYDINNPILNISSNALITGCWDNTSLGNYSVKVNATDTTNATLNNTFNLEIFYQPDIVVDYISHNIFDIDLYNASITMFFGEDVDVELNVDGLTFDSLDNNIHTIIMSPLLSDTIYNINFTATDEANNSITIDDVFKTKSIDQLQLELSERQFNLFWCIAILVILFILYILAEVFRLELLGILAGIGILVSAFGCWMTEIWFFLIVITSGIFIMVRFLWGFFRGN